VNTHEEWIAARRRLDTQRAELRELLTYLRGCVARDLPAGTIAGVLVMIGMLQEQLVLLDTAIADVTRWIAAAAPGTEAPAASATDAH